MGDSMPQIKVEV